VRPSSDGVRITVHRREADDRLLDALSGLVR
jgi:histidinol-phosphate/aromatic aminotransferase/cobyric acid decarboxylase-like protein